MSSYWCYCPDAAVAINLALVEVVIFEHGSATLGTLAGARVLTTRRDVQALIAALSAGADDGSRLALLGWLATTAEVRP